MIAVLNNKTKEEVCRNLTKLMHRHGQPVRILCDNGLEFKNSLLEETMRNKQIELLHGSPYTPQTQGKIERFNRTLKTKLKN